MKTHTRTHTHIHTHTHTHTHTHSHSDREKGEFYTPFDVVFPDLFYLWDATVLEG